MTSTSSVSKTPLHNSAPPTIHDLLPEEQRRLQLSDIIQRQEALTRSIATTRLETVQRSEAISHTIAVSRIESAGRSQHEPLPPPPAHVGESTAFHEPVSAAPVEAAVSSTDEQPLTFDALYTPARRDEQRRHFTAISSAMESRKSVHSLAALADATSSITPETITAEKQNRLFHLICRLGALDPQFPQDTLYQKVADAAEKQNQLFHLICRLGALAPQDTVYQMAVGEICTTLGIQLVPASLRLITAFREQEQKSDELENTASLAAEKKTVSSALASLENLLSHPPEEAEALEDRNRAILATIRQIYSSPLYQALCTSGRIPLIDILHSIAIAQYTKTSLASTFEQIGRKLSEEKRPLPDRVNAIWNKLEKIGIDNGFFTTLCHYTFCLLIKIGLSYVALKIAQLFSLNWLIPHIGDERSILNNTPGALTDEIQGKDLLTHRTIRTVVLPAPTLGLHVAPEFRAALQALENNQLVGTTCNDFSTWAYTNLQDMSFTPEHPSTIALMALHNEYPLSFEAISLPQNVEQDPTNGFSEEDVHHHLSRLFQNQASSLENRGTHGDAGYYFPQQFLDRNRSAIEAIAGDAYRVIHTNRGTHTSSALKTAFTKLFHLGLARLHESVAMNLTAERTHRTALGAIRSTICASCIDRGGMMNAAMIHALDTDGSFGDLAMGSYYGRAILSHRRSPTKQSAEALSTLFDVIPTIDVRAFLLRITPEFSSTLRPAA